MSLIILEGPDGGGKTTLAEAIRSRCAEVGLASMVSIDHHGAYLGEAHIARKYLDSVMDSMDFMDEQSKLKVMDRCWISKLKVMDRCWISEPIYGDAYRGGANRISDADREALEAAAKIAGVKFVLCLPPLSICIDAWRSRKGSEYVQREGAMRQIWHAYWRSADLFRGVFGADNFFHHDYTTGDVANLAKELT